MARLLGDRALLSPRPRTEGNRVVDFAKKIMKARAEDLFPGETITAAVFAQPAGAISKQVGFGVGGITGGIVGDKIAKKRAGEMDGTSEAGIAAQLPSNKPLLLAVTSHRFLAFGHGAMSSKPKEIEAQLELNQLHTVDVEKKKLSSRMVLRFTDGSAIDFDIPKTSKTQPFVEAVHRLGGAGS